MKKSELRQLIEEEVKDILMEKEENHPTPLVDMAYNKIFSGLRDMLGALSSKKEYKKYYDEFRKLYTFFNREFEDIIERFDKDIKHKNEGKE